MENSSITSAHFPFVAARFIKEIGRGKDGARSLSREDAEMLYSAMLEGRVSDLEMGGILLAMRIKGETVEEIAGFLAAADRAMLSIHAPAESAFAPIVIPSYNGARKKANLIPLLAMLLAREGVPVLVHGVVQDPGRVTTAEIFEKLNVAFSDSASDAQGQFARQLPAFMAIEVLSPSMHRILAMRRILGVRSSTHTLVKLLQPFTVPALRLTSYTHPEYHTMLHQYFSQHAPAEKGAAFLMRGTEGETVASTGRAQQIDCFHLGECKTLVETENQIVGAVVAIPDSCDAETTAQWIKRVLQGEIAVPINIRHQVEHCLRVAKQLRSVA